MRMQTGKLIIKALFLIGMLVNFAFYAYSSFSFAVRPEGVTRGECAILAAIYFVGIGLLISIDEGSVDVPRR